MVVGMRGITCLWVLCCVAIVHGCAGPEGRPSRMETNVETTIKPFLMFEGRAKEAMDFYVSLFDDGKIESITLRGAGEDGKEGTVKLATFRLAGRTFMCFDSPISHGFTFTPSMSLFVDCVSEKQLDELFAKLSAGGKVMMPLDNYGFSRKFGWVADRFGVSWQLNLPGQ